MHALLWQRSRGKGNMRELPQWEFDCYALSLPRGHSFGDQPPITAWASADGLSCGAITLNANNGSFGFIVMRKRIDSTWTVVKEDYNLSSKSKAQEAMELALKEGNSPEPLSPGIPERPTLFSIDGRMPSDVFKLLARPSHLPAAWALNQLYLALPRPDRNWASDCQTTNFHARLWEAILIGCFREQGLHATQPFESPDFRIENRLGGEAWVEAVTSNPAIPYNHVNSLAEAMPTAKEDIFFGRAALRFAKTIGNKLGRSYHQLPHVAGKPFIIAIADFQAPASMIWSREGLIGYLYGKGARVIEIDGKSHAIPFTATHLLGPSAFPAGLFSDNRHAELSAIIFSNACSIAKLNRVPISAGGAPKGFRYTRIGNFFDRTPGALKGVPFCLDVTSEKYRALWPHGYEPWSAELEVFHNPFAQHPVSFDLLPEATHWFDQGGEIHCRSIYETSILWSQTLVQGKDQPPPTLKDFVPMENVGEA